MNAKGWPGTDTVDKIESAYSEGKKDGYEEAKQDELKNMLLFCMEKLKEAEERCISIQQLYFELESESLTL